MHEATYSDVFLVPCAIAAASSFAVRNAIVGASHLVVLDAAPIADGTFMAGVVLVAIACGLGARLFARSGELVQTFGHIARVIAEGGRALRVMP